MSGCCNTTSTASGCSAGRASSSSPVTSCPAPTWIWSAARSSTRLVAEIGETCNISIPDGTRMIYAERVESRWPLRIQLPTGTPVPLHCTASGKLYLSQLAPSARKRILQRLPLTQNTRNSICDIDQLEAELRKTRQRGYAWDNEEFIEGLVAVAVPIKDPKGRFCAGLALHAPIVRMTLEIAVEQLPKLRASAQQIEVLLADQTPGDLLGGGV